MADAQVEAVLHAQNVSRRIGSAQMAVEVYGWAIKNATSLSTKQLNDLMDIVTKDEE